MTLGTLYITLLRIIHIFAAVAWVGGGIFLTSILSPTVQAAGPDGGRFMMRLASFGRMSRVLTVSSLLTVLAGLLLFWPTSGHLNPQWLSSAHGIVLTIGAILGILAFLHGAFVAGRATNEMGVVANEILAKQGPPAPEKLQQAQLLGAKLGRNAIISVTLGSLALLCMAAAPTI